MKTTSASAENGLRLVLSPVAKKRLWQIAIAGVLLAAWALPVYYAGAGIEWTQLPAAKSLPPANWTTAEEWATRTLWIGAAVCATLATAAFGVAALRGKTHQALGFASTMILVEFIWVVAGLTFIGVTLNALVMN